MTKFLLMAVNDPAYTFYVTETTVTRPGNRNNTGGQPPQCGFFTSVAFARLFYGRALVGVRSRTSLPVLRHFQTCHVPAHPIWKWAAGLQLNTGGCAMQRSSLAHTGQTKSPDFLTLARNGERYPLTIIRAALREAATAPTVFDALDLTGDALRRLADLAKAEGDHA